MEAYVAFAKAPQRTVRRAAVLNGTYTPGKPFTANSTFLVKGTRRVRTVEHLYLLGYGIRSRVVGNMTSHGINRALAIKIHETLHPPA